MSNLPLRYTLIFRVQREQILAKPDGGLDPGPPEARFSLEPTELRDETEKELQHLRQDKARLEAQLQAAWEQVALNKDGCFEVRLICFCFVWWTLVFGLWGIRLCIHASVIKPESVCFCERWAGKRLWPIQQLKWVVVMVTVGAAWVVNVYFRCVSVFGNTLICIVESLSFKYTQQT